MKFWKKEKAEWRK